MKNYRTIGDCLDETVSTANAELAAAREVMRKEPPLPDGKNPFIECRRHMAQAISAILTGAASFGGHDNVMDVLEQVFEAQNLKFTYNDSANSQ